MLLDLDSVFRPEADIPPAVPDISPDDLPPDWRDDWEERAAIMEYDGGLPKEEAEAAALAETLQKMIRQGHPGDRSFPRLWRPPG
jgi:hypothetical protein